MTGLLEKIYFSPSKHRFSDFITGEGNDQKYQNWNFVSDSNFFDTSFPSPNVLTRVKSSQVKIA